MFLPIKYSMCRHLFRQDRVKLFTYSLIGIFLIIFTLFTNLSFSQTATEPKINLKVYFGKPYYSATEQLAAFVQIDNPGQEDISGVSVRLEAGQPHKLGEEIITWPRTINRREYLGTVEPGQKEIEITQDLSLLNLEEGVYPVKVTVYRWSLILSETEIPLVIINPIKRTPLQVVLTWNLHERVHFNPEGIYLDDSIIKSFQRFPQKPGYLSNFISALDKHPKIKTSTNISPLLLEQIIEISEGYKINTAEGVKKVDAESDEASFAQQTVKNIKDKAKSKQLEILPSPFSYASLSDLADRDWDEDGIIQCEKGINSILVGLDLSNPPEGFYSPDLLLTGHSIKYLTENDVQYTILSQELFETIAVANINLYQPYRVQDINNNKLTVFFADYNAEKIITANQDPEQIQQMLLAYLAQVYLAEPIQPRTLVIAPTIRNWQPSFELMDKIYQTIDTTPWLKSVNPKAALETVPAPVKPLSLPDSLSEPSFTRDEYYSKINQIRKKVNDFKDMASKDNVISQEIERNLLISEGSDWVNFSTDPKLLNAGLSFIDAIDELIKEEIDKIIIPEEQTVTLTSKQGKIPISITNNSQNSYTITIHLESSNISFPEGEEKNIVINPKENLITIPVKIKKAKNSKIKVTLKNNKLILSQSEILVKSTYISRMIIIILTLVLILTILIILIIASRRKVRRTK